MPVRGPHKKVPVRARSEESIMAKAEGKLIANNKKAYHDYFILEKYEAGIVLHGTEVKSLRMGKCSIKEAFIRVESGEMFLYGMHISPTKKEIFLIRTRSGSESCSFIKRRSTGFSGR